MSRPDNPITYSQPLTPWLKGVVVLVGFVGLIYAIVSRPARPDSEVTPSATPSPPAAEQLTVPDERFQPGGLEVTFATDTSPAAAEAALRRAGIQSIQLRSEQPLRYLVSVDPGRENEWLFTLLQVESVVGVALAKR
jgi:hypothetical protein